MRKQTKINQQSKRIVKKKKKKVKVNLRDLQNDILAIAKAEGVYTDGGVGAGGALDAETDPTEPASEDPMNVALQTDFDPDSASVEENMRKMFYSGPLPQAAGKAPVVTVSTGQVDPRPVARDPLELAIASIDGLDTPVEVRSCLLYTSPSPRDLSTSRMPSSA